MTTENELSWQDYLSRLEQGMAILAARVGQSSPPVIFVGSRNDVHATRPPEKNEVFIGIGSCPPDKDPAGICLNNKVVAGHGSVVDFVLRADHTTWASWKKALEVGSIEEFMRTFTLYVEDVSPDSCLGLIFFLALAFHVPPDQFPAEWGAYAHRWEQGDVKTTGEPFSSWGALLSSLGHGFFDTAQAKQKDETCPEHAEICQAWVTCLRFDIAALRSGFSPSQLQPLPSSPEYWKAVAFLNYDHQQYLQSLEHAQCVQLLIPMTGVGGSRFKLVDAYFSEELIPLGSLKVFSRNDRNAWLRDGFSLMAIYRPSEKGSGNDLTISLDPATGIHLRDLWNELEKMEDERWGADRPSDNPRLGVHLYPLGKRKDGSNSPNQPWWDGYGTYTLLGAPKMNNGVPGSRLEWKDVRNAVWRMYHPLRYLRVTVAPDTRGKSCSLEELCAGERHGKQFTSAFWAESGLESPSLQKSFMLSPTVKRCFAACAAGRKWYADMDELPDEASFDVLALPGGLAVIHQDGVFVLDDWRNDKLNMADMKEEFGRIKEREVFAKKIKEDLDRLAEKVTDLFSLGRRSTKTIWGMASAFVNDLFSLGRRNAQTELHLLGEIAESRREIQSKLNSTGEATNDPHVSKFRTTMESRWLIAQRLEELHERARQMESSLRDYSELRTNRVITGLTIYGFPAVLLGSFFQFVLQNLPAGKYSWGGVHWFGIGIYLALTAIFIIFIRIVIRRSGKKEISTKPIE